MPYEVSETGWGEFEIVIKIHFHDPNEKPVTNYKHFYSKKNVSPRYNLTMEGISGYRVPCLEIIPFY